MKLAKLLSWLTHPLTARLALTSGVFLLVALLAYNRYPTYWDSPNFYAEDGTVFAQHILDKGFFGTLFSPFNGYFIMGLYLLEGLGFAINSLFMQGNVLNLPQALALVSYGFWALLCTLPLLLFWKDFRRKAWLVAISVSLALVPMPAFNYAVLGTIGNYKFAFLFIAFLLLMKRWQLRGQGRAIYAIDAVLLVCAFTNATVYLLLPIALLAYWPGRAQISKAFFGRLLRTPGFLSLVVLGGLAALQLAFIALRGGVDELAGYLQEPFQMAKAIEIFLQRTLLYPLDHSLTKHLNDTIVVLATLGLSAGLWLWGRRQDRGVLLFGLWAAVGATALFVSQRPGVSQFFNDYQSSGTDHFFYTQNLIFLFCVLYIAARRIEQLDNRWLQRGAMILVALVPLSALVHNDFSANSAMNRTTGSLWYSAQQTCQTDHQGAVDVPIYPVSAQTMPLNRQAYCTKAVASYTPNRQPLPLVPANNNYVQVNAVKLSQTFTARYNNLSGVSIFFSTFGNGGDNTYTLNLYDKTCRQRLRSSSFSASPIADNSYFDVGFPAIAHSKNQQYCFTVSPKQLIPGVPVLAVQFSAPAIYVDGVVVKDGTELSEDLVFDLLYR